MKRRHITRTLGAAVGGILGAAYLPAAFAFADDYTIVLDPSSTETVTGLYGLVNVTAPPAVQGSVQGYGLYDYVDTTTHQTVGTFDGFESAADLNGNEDQVFQVTSDVTGTPGTGPGEIPYNGSVLAFETEGRDETIYSDLTSPSGGSDVVTQTKVTPYGSTTRPDPNIDASKGLPDHSLGNATVPLADHYNIVPVTPDAEQFTAINGFLPPDDVVSQGNQVFDFVGPTGTVGSFDAVETNTADLFGNYSEALLVTSDVTGTPGTAPGDVPPPGSIFNILYYTGGGTHDIYSDLPSTNGNVISDTLVNAHGQHANSTLYDVDAEKALDLQKFEVPSGNYSMVPTTNEIPFQDISGVNGLPPYDVAVQGYEQFNIDDPSGTQIGLVDTDVTDILRSNGGFSEALIVTNDVSGTNDPPVGSVFDMITGRGGNYLIYSDIPSQNGGDVIKEYSVNPTSGAAHAVHTTVDLAAGLNHDQFVDPFTLSGVAPADATGADLSALASSVDPSGAITPDSVTDPLLNSGALLDAFPHLEAALQFLTGLF